MSDLVNHHYVHDERGRHHDADDIAGRICTSYPPDEIASAKTIVDQKLDTNFTATLAMIHGLRPDQVDCAKKEYVDQHNSTFVISQTCRELGSATPAPDAPAPAVAGDSDVIVTLTKAGKFTKFLQLLDAAHLTEKLKTVGPFTVFAPTDDAFAKLPPGTFDGILSSQSQLEKAVPYHIAVGRFPSSDLKEAKSKKTTRPSKLPTLSGNHHLIVERKIDNTITVAGRGTVVQADLAASNGLIYSIDTWLQP